jgi:hypothetical protein
MNRMGGKAEFMSTEMTPRAWRMLAYCTVGFAIYGFVFALEMIQDVRLHIVNRQLERASVLSGAVAQNQPQPAEEKTTLSQLQ